MGRRAGMNIFPEIREKLLLSFHFVAKCSHQQGKEGTCVRGALRLWRGAEAACLLNGQLRHFNNGFASFTLRHITNTWRAVVLQLTNGFYFRRQGE